MIEKAGYECEVHQVETQDFYQLKVHRMKPKQRLSVSRVVFLMHGLYATAAGWISSSPFVQISILLLIKHIYLRLHHDGAGNSPRFVSIYLFSFINNIFNNSSILAVR